MHNHHYYGVGTCNLQGFSPRRDCARDLSIPIDQVFGRVLVASSDGKFLGRMSDSVVLVTDPAVALVFADPQAACEFLLARPFVYDLLGEITFVMAGTP
jgi:hypothetical protein